MVDFKNDHQHMSDGHQQAQNITNYNNEMTFFSPIELARIKSTDNPSVNTVGEKASDTLFEEQKLIQYL